MGELAVVFETVMIILFGISWPVSIIKSYKAKSAKGKSLFFLLAIFLGYICGIAGKILSDTINLAFIFYVINAVMVSIDIVFYFINTKYDRA